MFLFCFGSLYFQRRLRCGERFLRGASLPGMPGIYMGQGNDVCSTITNVMGDVQDLFIERIEGDILAERHARVDDLALLVELIASSWKSMDGRFDQLESRLQGEGAVVYRLEDRQAG